MDPDVRNIHARYDDSEAMEAFRGGWGLRPKPGTLRTIRAYRIGLYGLFKAVGIEDLDDFIRRVKAGEVDFQKVCNDYLKNLAASDLSDNSLNVKRASILKFSSKLGLGLVLESVGIIRLKRTFQSFTQRDIQKLLATAMTPQTRTAILLLASSGIRIGELCQLELRDFPELNNREEPYLLVIRPEVGKGNRGYHTFYSEEAAIQLRQFIESKKLGPGDRLFRSKNNLGEAFRRLALKSLGPDYTPHGLRRYVLTSYLQCGLNETTANLLLGHGMRSITSIYNKPDLDYLRREYSKSLSKMTFLGRTEIPQVLDTADEIQRQVLGVLESLGIISDISTLPRVPSLGIFKPKS